MVIRRSTAIVSDLVNCPDAEALAQLASDQGDPAMRGAIADHASDCISCHAALVAVFGAVELQNTLAEGTPRDSDEIHLPGQQVMPGRHIDRYVVGRRLGAGGMGVVYQARDPELERDVAIKMLHRGAPAERLRREAQALARLSHPNVVAVYDVGQHDGKTFIAMALVDGQTLRRWLATEHSGAEILRVLCSAARGIEAAHGVGLIHRDLKPDNIFISRTGDVLVGDFGLAGDRSDVPAAMAPSASGELTMTGTVLGTPAYMAPEQAAGAATARSDQFSFCVSAYEALYNVRPFAGDNLAALVATIERGAITAPARDPGVAASVERALRRGLSADPAARFPEMGNLIAAIAPRKKRWPWIAASTTALGAAIAVTWGVTRSAPAIDPEVACAPVRSLIDPAWSPARRATVVASLRANPRSEKAAADLGRRLDDYAARWTAARHDTCVAEVTAQLAPDRIAARVSCLELRKSNFEALLASIATDKGDVFALWKRVASLPPAITCRDESTARLWSGSAEHQALMLAFAKAGTSGELEQVQKRAEQENDLPAQLAIALAVATSALDENRLVAAETALRRALPLAESLDVSAARVRALALSGRSLCLQDRRDESDRFLEMAEAAARRLPGAEHELELDEVVSARAECLYRRDQHAAALPLLIELLARARSRNGENSLEEYGLRGRLGLVYRELGRHDEAEREIAEWSRIHSHLVTPDGAAGEAEEMAVVKALERGDIYAAIDHQRRAVASFTAAKSPARATSLADLAMLYEVITSWRAAVETYTEALRLMPAAPNEVEFKIQTEAFTARGEAFTRFGEHDKAIADFERAIKDAETLKRSDLVIRSNLGLGKIALARREYVRALRILREAVTALAKSADPPRYSLGDGQFALAQAAWETGDRDGARAAARDAEANLTRSLEETQKSPMLVKHIAQVKTRLAAVARWRDTHR